LKKQQLYITLFLTLIWSFSFTQQYTNYSIKDGLPSNHVYRITQDYEGFIWVITDKGISKLDGKTFKNFTIKDGLPSNDIWNIRITPDNKIWYFSKANKLGYIQNDKVYAFSTKKKEILYPRIILQAKNTIAFDDGEAFYILKDSIWKVNKNEELFNILWCKQKVLHDKIQYHSLNKTRDSISFYKNDVQIKVVAPKSVRNNTTIEHGQINDSLYCFIDENQYGILNLNTQKITEIYYPSQNLPKRVKYVREHLVNHKIQFTGMNFVAFLDDNLQLKNITHIPENLNSHFSFVDKTGNVWSATFNKGVFMLPKESQHVKIVGKGKKAQQIKLIANNVYAGVYKEGFFRITDTLQPIIKNNDFQYSIANIDGLETVFFSSEYDIYAYKNKKISKLDVPQETPGRNTFARELIEFKGALYGNNSFGIRKINSKSFTTEKKYRLFGAFSFSKTKTQLFIGNQTGLLALKNDSIVKLRNQILYDKPVLSQVNLNDSLVAVGTDGYGAYVTNGSTTNFIKKSDDLSIQSIFIDTDEGIWLATQKGVYNAIKSNGEYIVMRSFFESDGLISNNTNSVVRKNDSLYVATDLGISILDLKQEKINQLQSLYIKSITANTKTYLADSISMAYENNNYIAVSFGAINYSNQQNLLYQYKLEPIQNKWIKTTNPEINFTDLKPKTYHLQLKVENHQGDEKLKTIVIKITPLWWQTIGFKVTLVLLACIVFYFFNLWNKKNIEEKTRKRALEKQKMVEHQLHALRTQMNPHFVFNSLAAIQYYISENNFETSELYLVKFSKLIRQFFEISKENEISLSTDIHLLESYLEIEKLRFKEKLNFTITIDRNLDVQTTLIPTMLLQPIVENAVNHGVFNKLDSGTVTLSFIYIDIHTFKVQIMDNGVGFKNTLKKHRKKINSSSVLKERLYFLNQSRKWSITYNTEEVFPNKNDRGNKSIFIIKHNN